MEKNFSNTDLCIIATHGPNWAIEAYSGVEETTEENLTEVGLIF